MQNNVEPDFQSQLDAVFAQLNPQAVAEFYAAYQQWSLQQRKNELRQRIKTVRAQQAENGQRLREAQPSAIAFAALARLQSNGVSDIALLDAMLERGESWLDKTMQRLDYFEQFDDFVSDDYTKWCQGALEGAFDWIDSLRDGTEQAPQGQIETPPEQTPASSEDAAEVEALFLQRLATEHEDDLEWQEAITLKRPAIQPQGRETAASESVEQEPPAPADEAQQDEEIQAQAAEYIPQDEQETESRNQAAEYIPQDEPDQSDETVIAPDAADLVPAVPEEQILPEEPSPVEESALAASEPDQPALIEFAPPEEPAPDEEAAHAGDEEPPLIETVPADEPPAEDKLYIGSEEPALAESVPADEPSAAEDTVYAVDEAPTLVEFAALSPAEGSSVSPVGVAADQEAEQTESSEVSQEEETSDQGTESAAPAEVPAPEEAAHNETNELDEPEDVPANEETAYGETGEPGEAQEMEQGAPQEPASYTQEAPPSSQPVRGNPRKAGLMRRLVRFVTGI